MTRLGVLLLAAKAIKPGLGVSPPTASDEHSSMRSAPPATAALKPWMLSTQTSSKMPIVLPFETKPISADQSRRSSAKLRRQSSRIRTRQNLPALRRGLHRATWRQLTQFRFDYFGGVLDL